MPRDFIPRANPRFLPFTTNFRNQIAANREAFLLTEQAVAEYSELVDAFSSAFQTAAVPTTRTQVDIISRDTARKALEAGTRALSRQIRCRPEIPLALKNTLGVIVRKSKQTRTPTPDQPPGLMVRNVTNHAVALQLYERFTGRRSKPDAVEGATILLYAGDNPPAGREGWRLCGQTSRTRLTVQVPNFIPAGAKVYFTACWFNRRRKQGPFCPPVAAYVAFAMPVIRKLAA